MADQLGLAAVCHVCGPKFVSFSDDIGDPFYTVSQKTVQICFRQNFVKFPQISIIFGRKMAKRLQLCDYARCTHFPPHLIHVIALSRNVLLAASGAMTHKT